MKKILVTILTVLSILLIPGVGAKTKLPEKTDHEKVKVYLFWSSTCHNCHNLIEYFSNKYNIYEDYFEIVTYQTNNDKVNSTLSNDIAKQVGEDPGYVPLVIIGDTYHVLGWDESVGKRIIDEALKAYQDENYTDIVKKAIKDNNLSPKAETIAQAAKEESISVKDEYTKTDITEVYENHSAKKGLSDGAVIAIVFGVIILGFAGLVVLSRK